MKLSKVWQISGPPAIAEKSTILPFLSYMSHDREVFAIPSQIIYKSGYLCSVNKYTDQLLGYFKPDLHLCFRVCKDLYYTRNTCTRTQMFGDVPVVVTFFISSSVCRHCKTTYDVFGIAFVEFTQIWLSNKLFNKQDFYFKTARSLGFQHFSWT